jgi:hypothetical protein
MTDSELEGNWARTLKLLWLRVLLAVNKALALGVAIAIHKGLDEAAKWLVPAESWGPALTIMRVVFFTVFAVVYVHFAWEVLTTFIPKIGWERHIDEAQDAIAATKPVQE